MKYGLVDGRAGAIRAGCLVLPLLQGRVLTSSGERLDHLSDGALSRALASGDLGRQPGDSLLLRDVAGSERILLVSLGDAQESSESAFVKAAGCAFAAGAALARHDMASFLCEAPVRGRGESWKVLRQVLAANEAAYRPDMLKTAISGEARGVASLSLFVTATDETAQLQLRRAAAVADGMDMARRLSDLPGNVCTPAFLAQEAKKVGTRYNFDVEVLEKADMHELGMGALLAVSAGSALSPKLIIMRYLGARPSDAPVVLVGKGITFDTGGNCIKAAAGMDEMKYDMAGAAAIIALLGVAAELRLPINVTAVIPVCENMPGGSATRPGDIVRTMSGQTVEILNTDLEGRLVLCDALSYARRLKPAAVVDVATLTMSCIVALGHHHSALFTEDEALAEQLLSAGQATGDPAWRMPLNEEYGEPLASRFADFANMGVAAGASITAASFLSHFTQGMRWAHLDICGTAWRSGPLKGATGRPVALLAHFLEAWAQTSVRNPL